MMQAQFLLDTDIASYYLRGEFPALVRRINLLPAYATAISVITFAELLAGKRRLDAEDPRATQIQRFINMAVILPWDDECAAAYADVRLFFEDSNEEPGELDLLIAAHALARDLTLVSNNTRHFHLLAPPLKLENWTQG